MLKRTGSSVILLGVLISLPFILVVGGNYFSGSHPLESRIISEDSFLATSENDVEVVFFGFVGCSSVCPSSLLKLSDVLESDGVKESGLNAGGTFVEVNLSGATGETEARHFSELFSKKIRGIYPGKEKLNSILREFSAQVTNNRNSEHLITHTDHFYIVNQTGSGWKITAVLSNGSNKKDLLDAILQSSEKGSRQT